MKRIVIFLLMVVVLPISAQVKTVTTVVNLAVNDQTNILVISSNEVARLVFWQENDSWAWLDCVKDGRTFSIAEQGAIIAGPAQFTLSAHNAGVYATTFQITPQTDIFPPDQTLIIPQDSPGAFVTMQMTTNLMEWETVTKGFYTGTNGARFFRIWADRMLEPTILTSKP